MLIFFSLLLVGCAKMEEPREDADDQQEEIELVIDSFMLKADRSYLTGENVEEAEVYIVDPSSNTVYVEKLGEEFTEEELEAMEDMTA